MTIVCDSPICLTEIFSEIELVFLSESLDDVEDVPKNAKSDDVVKEFHKSEFPTFLETFCDIELVTAEPSQKDEEKDKDSIDLFFFYFIYIICHDDCPLLMPT